MIVLGSTHSVSQLVLLYCYRIHLFFLHRSQLPARVAIPTNRNRRTRMDPLDEKISLSSLRKEHWNKKTALRPRGVRLQAPSGRLQATYLTAVTAHCKNHEKCMKTREISQH